MGVLADFFVATDATASRYTDHPEAFAHRIQEKRLTPLEVSTLWALLADREWTEELVDDFEAVLFEQGGELMIHRLPSSLVDGLAAADDARLGRVGAAWAATEELDWPAADGQALVRELAALCRHAGEASQSVYLWNCV